MTQLSREKLEEIAELARKASYKHCAVHMTNLIAVCDSEVIEEMARHLLAAEPVSQPYTLPQWIPCSERMPKKSERVLIFIDFGSDAVPPSIHDAQFTGSTFRRGNATVNVYPLEDGFGVTHWMPLPAAPQEPTK